MIVLFAFVRFFAWLWMPWFTYFSVIVRLFKVDPSKGQMPRDPTAVEKAEPADLLKQAKERIKSRVPITQNPCSLAVLNFEALISQIFTCRHSKFGRILEQGTHCIRKELDLFNFLKKMKEIQATMEAVTTFEQRRLIKQQVKAGLLVAPVDTGKNKDADGKDGKKKGNKKLWGSSDEETSSEEDLNFLEERLKKHKDLAPADMKFLRGIIQPPFKDRKNPERFKKRWNRGEGDTDASDEEAGSAYKKSQVAAAKKGKMSLEEQIKERNLNANQFNFYAMDKPAQN